MHDIAFPQNNAFQDRKSNADTGSTCTCTCTPLTFICFPERLLYFTTKKRPFVAGVYMEKNKQTLFVIIKKKYTSIAQF